MEYEIKQIEKRIIIGSHTVGSWEQTVKQGLEQLMMQVGGKRIVSLEWVAVYYNDPDIVLAEKLRCDTVVSVSEGLEVPEDSEGMIQIKLAGGDYAIVATHVENYDFTAPWYQPFECLLQDSAYAIAAEPCFGAYMNNGIEDGYRNIEMCVLVQSEQLFPV